MSSSNAVEEAVRLLASLGVENLCIPSRALEDQELLLLLPICESPERHRWLQERVFSSLEEEEAFYLTNIIGALFSVVFVAIVAGLFLGLLTLDVLDLQIIQRASIDEDERHYATNLLPIVKERHQLLVTLLLMNALAYETLPIFLDALVPSWAAVLLSVTIIMIFGEILPSGIFTGPNQLYLGNAMVPLVKFFLFIMYPFAKPLAKVLDFLTEEGDGTPTEAYNRGELSALVRIQHEQLERRGTRLIRALKNDRSKDQSWSALKAELLERVTEIGAETDHEPLKEQYMPPLEKREVDLVEGALKMKTNLAMDIFTPYRSVYAVPDNLVLDKSNITLMYSHGYSRVPVYRANPNDPEDRQNVVGFLITRQLMLVDWEDERELSTLPLQRPTCVSARMNLIDLFEILQTDGLLMTFVCARPDLANKALAAELPIPVEAGLIGIITLVDILESILQDRIYDER